jgi:O-methyltransferase involved in polyketide biosynthesis
MSREVPGDPVHQAGGQVPVIDVTVAHNARVWNYWLDGKDNYEVDRVAGDQVRAMHPGIVQVARADRAFLGRVVRFLAGQAGIRQFLDIGTGLPTAENTHQVAEAVAPAVRVVYVDNDPVVLAHARALLATTPPAVTSYVNADVHDPDAILRAAAETLDLGEPVAVMMLGILNFVLDNAEAKAIVQRLLDAVVPGSYLALSHPTLELGGEGNAEAMRFWNEHARPPIRARGIAEIRQFLTGLDLADPGLVSCALWRPDGPAAAIPHYGAVAVKPVT